MELAINPAVMQWAVKRSGISEEQICKKFKKYPEWLSKKCEPTLNQLMQFANMVHIQLYDFYSPSIPDYGLKIADFRTVTSSDVNMPSPKLFDTISLMRQRQNWLQDYFLANKMEEISLVGA